MWLSDRIDQDYIDKLNRRNKNHAYGVSAGLWPEYSAIQEAHVLEVKKIIKNGPATIVFWTDGTKTIVKLQDGDQDDIYAAFTAALAEKVFGSTSKARKIMKKALKESEGK